MILRLGDKDIKVNPQILQSEISKSTGKEIEKFSFNTTLKGEKSQTSFLELLNKFNKGGVYSVDEKGKILKEYKISNNSFSYTGNIPAEDTLFHFAVELTEVEILTIESLIISGIEIAPYEYLERFDEDALIIEAKFKLPSVQINELLDKTKNDIYFPVVRKGINEETKTMRFGQIFWSENDRTTKYHLVLVDKSYEEFKDPFHSEMINIKNSLAYTSNYIDELAELLIAKKLLSAEETKSLTNKAKDRQFEKTMEFRKVEDIDLYF